MAQLQILGLFLAFHVSHQLLAFFKGDDLLKAHLIWGITPSNEPFEQKSFTFKRTLGTHVTDL